MSEINPLVLSFPNFTLGQIIDPEQANQNNADIANKVNDFIGDVENTNLAVIESIQDASLDVTTLATSIDDEVTTIEVAGNMGEFPDAPGKALIIDGNDYEVFKYSGKDGNNFTGVTRGYLGPAQAFTAGVAIKRFLTAAEMDVDIDAIDTKVDAAIVTADEAETKADAAIITAEGADGKADSAILTAGEAETKADAAVITADEAETKADAAVITADEADVKADEAVNTANDALGQDETEPYTGALGAMKIAEEADIKADSAIVTADEADGKADSAILTADEAETKADGAIITADGADTKADEALGAGIADSGTATSTTVNTLTDTAKNWTVDEFIGRRVRITSGDEQVRTITGNTADTITVDKDWITGIGSTPAYEIEVADPTGSRGAMTVATSVEMDYHEMKPEIEQAVQDVEDKASEEWVNNQITDAKNELTNDIYRKDPVNTYDDLYTTYTEPEDGWIAMTLDSRNHYVYHAGEAEWKLKPTDINYADDDGTDGIITSTKFNKWNEHLLDVVKHGELIAFPGHYVVTEFDTPTAGDITETMYKSADDTVFLTKVTEFDTPTTEDITITIECVEFGIHNKSVTEFDTPTAGDIKETVSEVV